MENREIEAELQWFQTGFRGIFKYKNYMDKVGILIMYDEAIQTLKKLADDIGDSTDRLQVQEVITELRKKGNKAHWETPWPIIGEEGGLRARVRGWILKRKQEREWGRNRNKLDSHKRNMTLAAGKQDCVTCETNREQERNETNE